ncbi:MAG: hypothetical protein GY857_11765 [Desulfobacula sp.]|nr:hypothetical protein [Desulfobacula sp.]
MEDISRELEKEIARSKPKPYRQDRRTRLLVVDDFGEMKSGDHFKILVKYLSILSVICFAAAIVFYYLYAGLSKDSTSIKTKLDIAQKKVSQLNREKEVLMAKLVISGKKLDIVKKPAVVQKSEIKPLPSEPEYEEKKKVADRIEKEELPARSEKKELIANVKKKKDIAPQSDKKDVGGKLEKTIKVQESTPTPLVKPPKVVNKTVTIENFVVRKAKSSKDLLVRFDIRKISQDIGDVSGRIFTVLRPDSSSQDQWLVVPTTPLKNGIPSEYTKGQYFSIAHFKPVKFRIKNQAEPNFFKKASIFIFNEQKELIFEKLINITEAK